MEAFVVVMRFGLVILVMANGMAFLWAAVTGQNGLATAGRLNRWVGRTLWRGFCRTVSWAFRTIANIFAHWGR